MKRVLVCLGAGALLIASAGCGNSSSTTVKGEVGLTRDARGHVLALVEGCGSPVAMLDVAGSREGLTENQENPTLGEYVAAKPVSGTIRLDLEGDNQGWKTTKRFAPKAVTTKSIIVTGLNRESGSQTRQTTVRREQLDGLKPGSVLRADGSVVPEADFARTACS